MRFVILIPVLFFSALSLAACGGDAEEPVVEDVPLFEPNYTVVASDSRLGFSATQEGVGFTGEFTEFDAVILFDPAALETSEVRVTVPLSSFDGGSTDRNSNVSSNIWFDSRRFPVAVFKADSLRADGDSYLANGTLSLKGLTQPISFAFDVEETDGRAVMTAEFPINRTRWNVGQEPWNTEDYVGLNVVLDIRVVADRQP